MTDDAALFDVDSVRRLEAAQGGVLGRGVLMERAGQAAWRALLEAWPDAARIVVVCGPGGNGGDGCVLARLALESGRTVHVVASDGRPPEHAEARQARERLLGCGGRVEAFVGTLPDADVVVDAVLGIGLAGAPSPPAAALIDAVNAHGAPVLALDVPSGVGEVMGDGPVVAATRTVEFLLPKLMLRTGAALDACGLRALARLDVPAAATAGLAPAALALGADALGRYLGPRRRDSHKGRHGRVLCIGGDSGMGGAILLAAEGALRTGAGLVRVHTRPGHAAALLARLPEVMASTRDLDADWAEVVAIGPGLGRGDWGRKMLARALAAGRPLVVDADALGLLADEAPRIPVDCILTPHPGEAARLLERPLAAVQRDRPGALRALVERLGCAVILKGAGSLVGAPGRTSVLVDAGGPGLATAGTGDVLTGAVAALRAQGLDAFDAACAAALLHAAAGDAASLDGARGLRATDLMPHLRRLANP